MTKPTKWESEVQEAAYKFFAVPVIFLIGLYVASVIIQEFTGITDFFRWILFSAGLIGAIVYYFKKHLSEINW
ncbi:hypothetical protein J4433_03485 [Candidatus Pacearchaeota archaeon]|nr:hypothetical protein [Candidatus Pacearchaeota archaeon]